MQKTIRSTTTAIVAVALAALMLAPSGAAQDLFLTGTNSVTGIKPGLGGTPFDITFTYELPNNAYAPGALQKPTAVASVTPSCTENGFIVAGPSSVRIPIETGDFTGTATEEYSVFASKQAPGLTEATCSISASVGALASPAVGATETKTHTIVAVADYYGAMSVTLASSIETAAPYKQVPFSMELTNFGNAATRVSFSIAGEDDRPVGEKWQHVLPTDVFVGSAATGGTDKATTNFQVTTPYKTGWNNVAGTYLLTMNTEALDDPTQKGNTMTASVLVQVRGVYVPGFEAVAVVGSLLGSVMLLRRREE